MSISKAAWKDILLSGAKRIIAAQDELTDIDSRFGDADHGVTMTKIASGMIQQIEADSEASIRALMERIVLAVFSINGGSAGPLWGTLLEGMAKYAPAGDVLGPDELKAMFSGTIEALREITAAEVGDKTMMDALIPAVEAMEAAQGDVQEILLAGSRAAQAGAKNSANFASKFGRAKSYREQTIGTPDAGAVSMQYFFIGLYEGAETGAY